MTALSGKALGSTTYYVILKKLLNASVSASSSIKEVNIGTYLVEGCGENTVWKIP